MSSERRNRASRPVGFLHTIAAMLGMQNQDSEAPNIPWKPQVRSHKLRKFMTTKPRTKANKQFHPHGPDLERHKTRHKWLTRALQAAASGHKKVYQQAIQQAHKYGTPSEAEMARINKNYGRVVQNW